MRARLIGGLLSVNTITDQMLGSFGLDMGAILKLSIEELQAETLAAQKEKANAKC